MPKRWIDGFAELMAEVPLPPPEDMALARTMFALADRGRPLSAPPVPRTRPLIEGTVRARVVAVVHKAQVPLRPKDVHAKVNSCSDRAVPLATINKELLRAVQDGQLSKPGPGLYAAEEEEEQPEGKTEE